jgi:hypothetical protein
MDAQDRQSHTKGNAREDQRSAATIAPLVGLRVARSGTPPLQRPSGSLGCPQPPAYFDVERRSMSLRTGRACWCTAITVQACEALSQASMCPPG